MENYLEAFVREGDEHVANLNNALLELESDPGNEEAMDAIFRTVHTLKGNFDAMGFEMAGDLAHAVEDLLDAMRQDELAVTSDRLDCIFEGVDTIEACLADIEETGEVHRDVSATVATVRAVLDGAEPIAQTGSGTEVTPRPAANKPVTVSSTGDERTRTEQAPESPVQSRNADVESTDRRTQSVRVDVDQIDDLHGLVAQLVTTRFKLRRDVAEIDPAVDDVLDELDRISDSLQQTATDMRFVPLRKTVGKFPRVVRDLAREQDKEVEFVVEGDDVHLDRTILTKISDPLLHLLRNAVDHGIEPPQVREANGKESVGTVTLSAERNRDQMVIEVHDDGRGIDHERVREAARAQGIKSEAELATLPDAAVEDLVFHPGFSTNEKVTGVSGRGVGLDVVRDTVTRLDGSVSVSSVPGEGTTFTITLPVTATTMEVLLVKSGDEEYGIPIEAIEATSRMQGVEHVDGEETVTFDGTVYPLVRLGEALNVPGETKDEDGMLVRVRDADRQIVVHCDDVCGQEEVVVNPFEGVPSDIPALSGAAVLNEGDVVTILDVSVLRS